MTRLYMQSLVWIGSCSAMSGVTQDVFERFYVCSLQSASGPIWDFLPTNAKPWNVL